MLVTVKGVSSEKDPGRRLEVRQTTLSVKCLEFLSAAFSEPAVQRLLTFQVPNVFPFSVAHTAASSEPDLQRLLTFQVPMSFYLLLPMPSQRMFPKFRPCVPFCNMLVCYDEVG